MLRIIRTRRGLVVNRVSPSPLRKRKRKFEIEAGPVKLRDGSMHQCINAWENIFTTASSIPQLPPQEKKRNTEGASSAKIPWPEEWESHP